MKRALWILSIAAVAVLLGFAAVSLLSTAAWVRAGDAEWPAELGTLQELPLRFPAHGSSAEAVRLRELAKPLGLDFGPRSSGSSAADEAIARFVDAECARGVAAIEAPPAAVAELLTRQASAIDAVGEHLRQSHDIEWMVDLNQGFDAPVPNLAAHVGLARILVARSLVRARSGDPGAWEDLEAVSMLDRSLQQRPDLTSQVLALSLARKVNAAAWKLPLPAPAWLAESHATDRRRLLLQGVQADSWLFWRHASREGWLFPKAYVEASVANLVNHQRASALEISRVTACSFDGSAYNGELAERLPRWNTLAQIAMVNMPWSGVLRFEAEREATANALRVRAGQPAIASSRCSDGQWRNENGQLSFTREIPAKEKDMPLRLKL